MKRVAFCGFTLLILLVSCAQQRIIEHPAPELSMDHTYFSGQGCFTELNCAPEDFTQPDPPVTMIQKPADLLGGLTPPIPLAVGSTVLYKDEGEIPAVYTNRCMRNQFIRYLARIDDQTILIDSIEKMAEVFAPIDSAEEAFSYAIAATGYSALFDLETIKKPALYVDQIEESFVEEGKGDYVVHLFKNYLCGCGPHITQSVAVTVREDGTIQIAEPVDAFSDPQYDGLCVD